MLIILQSLLVRFCKKQMVLLFQKVVLHKCNMAGKPNVLGRILMLDIVIRNEDQLPCRHLCWRRNYANLLFAIKMLAANIDALEETLILLLRYRPRIIQELQKERRSRSLDCKMHTDD